MRSEPMQAPCGEMVVNLAQELRSNQPLLTAIAGPAVTLSLVMRGGEGAIAMTREDLSRILMNLTRNAVEAMSGGGGLEIALEEADGRLSLTFRDTGPGITPEAMERIFHPGYTTHLPGFEAADGRSAGARDAGCTEGDRWPVQHRGLGLAIVRSLVSAARGEVWAANREDACGAVFTIEFPLRKKRGAG